MTNQERFENWLRLATEDIKVAECLFNGDLWLNAAFYCQQAIEKLCKGLYIYYINNFPYSHGIKEILIEFESYLPVTIPKHIYDLVDGLSIYCIKCQDIDYELKLSNKMNKEKIISILSTTKEVFSWLLTLKK